MLAGAAVNSTELCPCSDPPKVRILYPKLILGCCRLSLKLSMKFCTLCGLLQKRTTMATKLTKLGKTLA